MIGLSLLLVGAAALTPEEEGQCGWSWGNLGCAPRDGSFIRSRDYLCELSARGCVSKPGNPHKLTEEEQGTDADAAASAKIVLALDWTPNTNHAGFFLAQAEGFYRDAGLEVELRSPDDVIRTGGLTPARQVAAGTATLAVSPSESAISFATSEPDKPRLLAVAAVLQGSTSAVCALADSGIQRPRDLAGRRYASYGGRFEDPIVRAMVRNDGGDGDAVECHTLPMHGYADASTVASGSAIVSQLQVQGRKETEKKGLRVAEEAL
jgi:ABC-type nitrate/sulfonate/bicarbonate transport system substrate-binding protein